MNPGSWDNPKWALLATPYNTTTSYDIANTDSIKMFFYCWGQEVDHSVCISIEAHSSFLFLGTLGSEYASICSIKCQSKIFSCFHYLSFWVPFVASLMHLLSLTNDWSGISQKFSFNVCLRLRTPVFLWNFMSIE